MRSTSWLGSLGLIALSACSTPSTPVPTRALDPEPGATRALAGNVPPMIRGARDLGRMDPETKLTGVSLLIRRSPDQKAASRALLADLENPTSPRYHHWLSPAEVAASFGAKSSDLAAAGSWLSGQGFTVHGPSPTGTRLLFSGTVAQLERAFATEMHRYEVGDETHFAISLPPSVPSELSRFVLGLRGVHDFQLRPLIRDVARTLAGTLARHDAVPAYLEGGGTLSLAPADFANIYDIAPLYAAGITGKGQKIGVVGSCDFNDADIKAFRADFGLDTSLVPERDLVPYSGASVVSDPNYFGETELDLEWSGAVAKEATIHYVYTGDNSAYGPFDAIVWAIEEGKYPILTASYAGCEEYYTESEVIYLESMGDAASMEGITVLGGSGDWGPAACDAQTKGTVATHGASATWPASIPSFVAVGGTMFNWGDPIPTPYVSSGTAFVAPFDTYWTCESLSTNPKCSAAGYVPESGWNEVSYDISAFHYFWGATGGGVSTLFEKPYWQVGTTPSGTMRLLPDVSVTAAWQQVGYVISQSWTTKDGTERPPSPQAQSVTGGTSAATPSFAGILALVNDALSKKNPSLPVGLGNANPVLYALNASTSGTSSPAFHDITTGDNMVPCSPGTLSCPSSAPYEFGFSATAGYDMVTGIGSVDVNHLVTAWTSLLPTSTTLTVTPSGTVEGATATLTATVASTGTATSLTGSVVFYVDTTDEGGLSDLSLSATGTLTPSVTGGLEGGTASASVLVPPGLLGQAKIVAFYGGDPNYLASWSTPASKVDVTSTLALAPATVTLRPSQGHSFAASGGVLPYQWSIIHDSTCQKNVCAQVSKSGLTAGAYQAGASAGVTTIAVIDADGAEARAIIQVENPGMDASAPDAMVEEGAAPDAAPTDAATMDATRPPHKPAPVEIGKETPDLSGCSCRSAGGSERSAPGGGIAGLLLLGLALRRRSAR